MWAADACEPAAEAPIEIGEIRYDADGDDNSNLNDEWVEFNNAGTDPIDLSGWGVKDESATQIARRSLASTTDPDGGIQLSRAGVIDLLELLTDARDAAGELDRLRERLLELVNDPAHRTTVIPLRELAALLR